MRLFRSSGRRAVRIRPRNPQLALQLPEDRTLLSSALTAMAEPGILVYRPAGTAVPFGSPSPPSTAFTPSQIRHAYGFDQIVFPGNVKGDGTGTTIAIVDAYD